MRKLGQGVPFGAKFIFSDVSLEGSGVTQRTKIVLEARVKNEDEISKLTLSGVAMHC